MTIGRSSRSGHGGTTNELRPIVISHDKQLKTLQNSSLSPSRYNSWGHARPAVSSQPVITAPVLVGDSFLEGGFVDHPLATHRGALERGGRGSRMARHRGDRPAVSPHQEHGPVAVGWSAVPSRATTSWAFMAAGNRRAAAPHGSAHGLIVNRLGLSSSSAAAAGPFDTVNAILQQPRRIMRFLKLNYHPDKDDAVMRLQRRTTSTETSRSGTTTSSPLVAIVEHRDGTWAAPHPPRSSKGRWIRHRSSTMSWLIGSPSSRGVKFLMRNFRRLPPAIDPLYEVGARSRATGDPDDVLRRTRRAGDPQPPRPAER